MTIEKIPIPKKIYRSVDEAVLPSTLGARLQDGYIDELGHHRRRPGLKPFLDLSATINFGVTGLFWWDENKRVIATFANGSQVEITSAQAANRDFTGSSLAGSRLTSITNDESAVYMANGAKIVRYPGSGTSAVLTDGDAPVAVSSVGFVDGYIVAALFDSDLVQFSKLRDGTAWNPLDVFRVEGGPDVNQVMFVIERELSFLGNETTEVWRNDGVTPFSRIGNAFVELGTLSRESAVRRKGSIVFLDNTGKFSAIQGRTTQQISSPLDNEVLSLSPISDAEAMYIPIGSREFYIVTFPTQDRTFVYDFTTGNWTEWGEFDQPNSTYKRFKGRVSTYAKDWDKHLVGDATTGKIYELTPTEFQDDGAIMRPFTRTGHIDHGTTIRKKRSNRVTLRFQRGVGNGTVDPQVMIRWRDNGSKEFNQEKTFSLGRAGDDEFFVELRRLGMYKTRQWEFASAADAEFILVDAEEEFDILDR